MHRPVYYIITGEASGDMLGAQLAMQIASAQPDAVLYGVGGEHMAEMGVKSLFPMQDIALMGFVEIVPHIPRVLQRLKWVLKDIRLKQPDMVITIDAPGFNKRVAKALQPERAKGMQLVHYVAPSVWAYKPERAKTFAALFDKLLCLLPFEPPYFEREGMEANFVGHPLLRSWKAGNGKEFRKRNAVPVTAPMLTLLPGSRAGEIKRHMPIFAETIKLLKHYIPDLHTAMLVPAEHLGLVKAQMQDWSAPACVVTDMADKADLFAASDFALSKSGTVTLELAMAQVPMVVTHKVHPLSARMMRKMIQTRFVNLVNILGAQEIIPELIQEFCRPDMLCRELVRLAEDPDRRDAQINRTGEQLSKLHAPEEALRKALFSPATASAPPMAGAVEVAQPSEKKPESAAMVPEVA